MAVEPIRGCGYRVVGGLYLCGMGQAVECDRFPVPILPCSVCGEEPRLNRGITRIKPPALIGFHMERTPQAWMPMTSTIPGFTSTTISFSTQCTCIPRWTCPVCTPVDRAFMMWVGTQYTPESFIHEALTLGVSKRIPFIPVDLKLGEDWMFFAYLHLISPSRQLELFPVEREQRGLKPGIFFAFRPTSYEYLITKSQSIKERELVANLEAKGITPIVVPDNDPDHNPRKRERR